MAGRKFPTYAQILSNFANNMDDFFRHPYHYNIKPFKIIGNVYYVGDTRVCIHLIDTGDGLILIDTGYPPADILYINNIYELGFDPHDIKYILHTHEHYDHFGATPAFVKLYGCKTMMSRAGYEAMRRNPLITMYQDVTYCHCDPAELDIDILIDDGDTFTLGNTTLTFKSAPGHAEGVLAIFLDTVEDGVTYRCGMFGGATTITMYREHCLKYGIPLSIREDFITSIDSLRGMKVDVVLGNHPNQNHTVEKRKLMLENPQVNPFIDPTEWDRFLQETYESYLEFLEFDQ